MMTRLAANVSLTLALCLPAAGSRPSAPFGAQRSGSIATAGSGCDEKPASESLPSAA